MKLYSSFIIQTNLIERTSASYNKQHYYILDEVFVISRIIKVEVSVSIIRYAKFILSKRYSLKVLPDIYFVQMAC